MQDQWKNRIVGQGEKPANEFNFNPLNWRNHPNSQRAALDEILGKIGWVTGEYSKLIKLDEKPSDKIILDEFPANVFYFCGVALPFNWENNFHLAFVKSAGSSFSVDEKNIRVKVAGAERIPINPDSIETVNHPRRGNKNYHTCRNWQFANYLSLNTEFLQV